MRATYGKRLPPLTLERVNDALFVDVESGTCNWKNPSVYHNEKKGREAGNQHTGRRGKDYWVISIDGIQYKRSYIVFLAATSRWPSDILDHRNGNSLDDAFSNLREASQCQNVWNKKKMTKKSRLPMGVRITRSGKFQARVGFMNKTIHLGTFTDHLSAERAYRDMREALFGEFA